MINALFVVWRECFEAVLIVGILVATLSRQPSPRRSIRFMWGGVVGGAILSLLLAYGVQHAETELEGMGLELFEAGMLITASVLMTQMCIWMRAHARTIKGELEAGVREAFSTAKLVGVAGLAALAIAREGFELVMFFYGMRIEATERGLMRELLLYSFAGVGVTALTAVAYYKGLKVFNARVFFRVTAVFLLVTASSLLLAGLRKLYQMDLVPTLKDMVWDTSRILDERTELGQFVSTMTGYESSPSLMTVLVYASYWAVAMFFYARIKQSESRLSRSP